MFGSVRVVIVRLLSPMRKVPLRSASGGMIQKARDSEMSGLQ